MIRLFKLLIRDNEAASAVEYAILVALIAAAIIITVQGLGTTLDGVFGNVDTVISATIPAPPPPYSRLLTALSERGGNKREPQAQSPSLPPSLPSPITLR